MKYTIYLSGCRVAEWSEETGYTYKTAPELIASYLEEMRLGEAELRERLACAQEAISQGEAEFILPSGEHYCRRLLIIGSGSAGSILPRLCFGENKRM